MKTYTHIQVAEHAKTKSHIQYTCNACGFLGTNYCIPKRWPMGLLQQSFPPLAQTSSYATGYEICATRLLTFKTTKNSRACTEFFVKYICKSVMCTYVSMWKVTKCDEILMNDECKFDVLNSEYKREYNGSEAQMRLRPHYWWYRFDACCTEACPGLTSVKGGLGWKCLTQYYI